MCTGPGNNTCTWLRECYRPVEASLSVAFGLEWGWNKAQSLWCNILSHEKSNLTGAADGGQECGGDVKDFYVVPQRLWQRRRRRHHYCRRASVWIGLGLITYHPKSVTTEQVCKTFLAGLMQAPCGQVGRRLHGGQCGKTQVAIQGLRLVNFCSGR